ncbi:group III truncated hemoglobin [Methylosinus sp. Sm6]|uniref:group III truncated hemoglobin n=1 Tax=Methylosinus sp. Sm6 TaxID=2866948 RepID=UPI001C99DFC9|nr:group III truncated hemoglobin [Methylosinus sp. Sm6]MBY6242512.1 group III truncated hemoglobin [Methylosinus sp. Sm6]
MFEFPVVQDEAERAAIETAISAFVRGFYDKGLADPLIGPVFAAIPDLDGHLAIIENFWSKSLLRTERYEGHPFSVHVNLPIEPEHFTRWLELFVEAARESLPTTQAEQAIAKATHMAQCFQGGLFPFTGADGRPSRHPPA